MTEEEYRAELEEAENLRQRINAVISQIEYMRIENNELENEIENAVRNVNILIKNCDSMDKDVSKVMGSLSDAVGNADISTKEVFQALNELTVQYFTFKRISTASKNVTRYNDEYYTRFSYYNELRRISLGYVVGLDSSIISSETARKKVEKAYLQNTEYWLAYCISGVMLWANDEKEAAERAVAKSLKVNYFNSCLFYLLINLRFNRIDAAKKWYVNFMNLADINDIGDEWQYLLQAYLYGAFGADDEFQKTVADIFKKMMSQMEVTTVDFAKKFTLKALQFAELYIHKTDCEFALLRRNCAEYEEMKSLLSSAEKNAEIAKYFDRLYNEEDSAEGELPQRIENVLYSLVNDYDDEELKVIKNMKYNEAIISAKGDEAAAQAKYDAMFAEKDSKKNFGEVMMDWAFAPETSQTDASVKHFAVSLMKESIAKGFEKYPEKYRTLEKDKYTFDIDDCKLECNENDYSAAEKKLDKYYDKNKLKRTFEDKHVLIYTGICAVALLLLIILFAYYSPVILTFGILTGLTGSFLLWRRIVDMGRIIKEKKRKSKLLLRQTLEELGQWRAAYKEADSKNPDLIKAIERF